MIFFETSLGFAGKIAKGSSRTKRSEAFVLVSFLRSGVLRFFVILPAVIFTSAAVGAHDPGTGVAQPTNYVSPSGAISLFVDPADRHGIGMAMYRLSHNGAELHAYEKPYSLREVTVTDRGLAAGIAYQRDEVADDRQEASQFLHIVILAPDGREILNDVKPRQVGHLHGPTLPQVKQVLVDPEFDRLMVRVLARGEKLWVYQLSTGESQPRLELRAGMGESSGLQSVVDTRLVPGTPLLLVHWLKRTVDPKTKDYGAAFALLDPNGECIWTFEADRDYANVNLGWVRYLGPQFFKRNSVISTGGEGRFDVRLYAEKKQVAFSVSRNANGTWQVVELGRIDIPDSTGSAAPSQTFPPLKYLGELKLGAVNGVVSPLEGLWDFTFDSRGRIHAVLSKADGEATMASLDENGSVVAERPLARSTLVRMGRHWIAGPLYKDDRYVEFRREGNADSTAWLIQPATGEEEPLKHFPGGLAMSIARLSDGSMLVLDTYNRQYSPADRLRCFDTDGQLRWELRSEAQKDYEILGIGPRHVSVTTQDKIILLNIDSIQLLDRDGLRLKKIDLKGAFGENEFGGNPGYLHEVVADADGGFLVANHRNPPVVLRYDVEGSLRSKWSPRHPDGKTFDLRPQIRVAPDGRLWTGDGNSLMRLTDDGVVDLVFGAKPADDQLKEMVAFTVDRQGKMYAVARGTAMIHVFDPQGKPLRIVKPDPGDVQGTVTESFIALNDNGEIFLKKPATRVFMPPDEYLRFSPAGEYIETVTFEPSIPVGRFLSSGWSFQPRTNYRSGICCIGGDDRLVLVDPPNTLIREQRKKPNGQWFAGRTHVAVAPDGGIVVLDNDFFGEDGTQDLNFFSPEADPVRTVELPKTAEHYTGLAFDGSRVAAFGKKEAVVVDVQMGRMQRWSLVPPGEDQWTAHFLPDSREVLLFEMTKHRLHRYEFPEQQSHAPPTGTYPDAVDTEETRLPRPEWVQHFQKHLASIPERPPCTVYIKKTEGGEQTMSEEQAMLLPEAERAQLRTMSLDDCGPSFDEPRMYQRLMEVTGAYGLDKISKKRVLDIGCCDLRGVQLLARMGAHVTKLMAPFSLTSMCNDWKAVGELTGSDGGSGRLDVLKYGLADHAAVDEFDLIIASNVIRNPADDDYVSSPAWMQIGIGWEKDAVATKLFSLLRPGGMALIYNISAHPIPVKNGFAPPVWEKAGFEVIMFDKDDRRAALTMGTELGWDKLISPLEKQLQAGFSILRKPDK